MKYFINKYLLLILILTITSCGILKKKPNEEALKEIAEKKEKPKPKKGNIKPYDEVITQEAKSDKGLFTVHQINDQYFYEIPDTLFNREMFVVTRVAKISTSGILGGAKQGTRLLRWQKRGEKVFLRAVSNQNVADTSLPIHEAVVNSNLDPILYAFPIKAFSKDSLNTVINVTDLFSKDFKAFGLTNSKRLKAKLGGMSRDKSFIKHIKSYPLNIEARHLKTYSVQSGASAVSVEINNSMVLLPKTPMRRRYSDKRVGWFTSKQEDFSADIQGIKTLEYIDRWRLEIKDEDIEKFKRGELVEPKKPIVFYIDKATPVKWRKYIKEGIESWQSVLEGAGFKNAIIAKDPPTKEEDPDWTPEDVRYSVVRYLASSEENATGPHVSDPRSGEVLEADINWYHNIMKRIQRWFFVQTAAVNPEAQTVKLKDEVMGKLIKYGVSHEVGHTLGLPHNFVSSYAYKVDDLRDPEFTKKYGTAPSIMDYARFNYVAQPGDNASLIPKIGIYDKYAINWGYRPILEAKTAEDEKETLNSWIMEHAGDPLYKYVENSSVDAQAEDLGDDAIKASTYGIANLKRIVPNLIKWTKSGDDDYYSKLREFYKEGVMAQYTSYIDHVLKYIAGVYEDTKTTEQKGSVYTIVDKDYQRKCVEFLNDQLFKTPTWLIDTNIYSKIGYANSVEDVSNTQIRGLNVFDYDRLIRFMEQEAHLGNKAYRLTDMLQDLRKGIWSELRTGKKTDVYRRHLQKKYIEKLTDLMTSDKPEFKRTMDIGAIVRDELNILKHAVKSGIARTRDALSKSHFQDVLKRIETALNQK